MKNYKMKNCSSVDIKTNQYHQQQPKMRENSGKHKSGQIKVKERKTDPHFTEQGIPQHPYHSYTHYDLHHRRGSIVVRNSSYRHYHSPHQSYHTTLVRKPLYHPGLNNYYRNINVQRRPSLRVQHQEYERPGIERLYSDNTGQSISQKIKGILFGNKDQ